MSRCCLFIFILFQITCVLITNYQSVNVHFYQVYKNKHLFTNYTSKKKLLISLDSLNFQEDMKHE